MIRRLRVLREEVARGEEGVQEWDGISIITDACHGWRKNAKDTSVVAIGDKSHKVLQHIHVTKGDDLFTQCHEKLVQRGYITTWKVNVYQ